MHKENRQTQIVTGVGGESKQIGKTEGLSFQKPLHAVDVVRSRLQHAYQLLIWHNVSQELMGEEVGFQSPQ